MTQQVGTESISVVVVCYRSAGDVVACLDAVRVAADGLRAEVLVIDNDSDDDTAAVVRRNHPDVTLIERGVNDGFARGCHAGADRASGDWLLFVNPDAVVDPGAVHALLQAALEHPRAGIVGGRSLHADGSTDPRSWWGRPTLWSTFCFATGLAALLPGHRVFDPESPERWDGQAREVPVVSGALMLVNRKAWDEISGFDTRFLLYGEDVDLCLRAAEQGWRPRIVPEATFRHAVGGSTPGAARTALVLRGRATVLRRHLRPGGRSLGIAFLVLGTGLRALGAGRRPARLAARRGTTTEPSGWQAAWRSRQTWRRGWRPGDRLGEESP